jgi:type II secretory ATPase GspE/PulE/Tfp pilus assembly ATPase PilB-like protein
MRLSELEGASALVAALIEEAAAEDASDIHLDPSPAGVRVRVRTDGILSDRHLLPPSLHGELIARLKILAALRTDEHYAPQDGRFRHARGNGSAVDVRLSVMPTYHGENAVMRLLRKEGSATLEELGFSPAHTGRMREALAHQNGLILATGPTGSGKTTTLYALIGEKSTPEVSIVTIEDPVEYGMEGVRQVAVNPRTGLTFATGLRSLLRQDPDVMMVGEIRDAETARIGIHTALTGHLVLSTLHTTDAAGAVPRLLDMGVEPYLIASTLRLIIAQRLVRTVCRECGGKACAACRETGYRGRTVVAEVLPVTAAVRAAILRRASAKEINGIAHEEGMAPIEDDAAAKILAGRTTEEEVRRLLYE